MSDARDRGKKGFAELSSRIKERVSPDGEPLLHARGLKAVEDLAQDLQGPEAPPGLQVFRDGPGRFRLQRPQRNGEVSITWQRPIGAIVIGAEKLGKRQTDARYVFNEAAEEWHHFDYGSELYADMTVILTEILYPEAKR